jgi:hypothetical protein
MTHKLMKVLLAMGLALVFGLVAGSLAAANQAENFQAGSVYLSNPSPCLGQTITLYATILNTDYPTDGAGQIDIKAALVNSMDYSTCTTSTTTVLADRWWVIYSSTTSLTPATPSADYNAIGQGGNGYQISGLPSGSPTWSTETIAIPFTISNTVSALGTDYLMVFLKANYVDPTSGTGFDDEICLPINVGSSGCTNPPPSGTLSEGVAGMASNGNIMTYWLDYNFFNATGLSITDVIPSCETILAYSPSPTGAAATVAGNTITWAVPDASLSATPYPLESIGSVWVEVQVGACSYPLCDQASFAGAGGLAGTSNNLCQANGQNVLLSKQQYDASFHPLSNGSSVIAGATVNYVLNYTISGAQLKCFDPFNYTVATSAPAANASPAWSGNWMADPQTGSQGASQWDIVSVNNDTCLQFVPASASDYRSLYYTCGAAAAQVASCSNIDIVADVRLDDPANQGLDAGIWVQSDNGACPIGYLLVLSGDSNAGAAANAHMAIQRNNGTCGSGCCNWTGAAPNTAMYSQVWYTAEVLMASPGVIYAKFWQRGTPEPTGWMLTYTDSAPLACPGVSNHIGLAGLGGQTEFDNFQVSVASSVSNASVWDTVPAGIGFQASAPAATGQPAVGSSNGLVHWDFTGSNYGAVGGALQAGSGSFTWSGLAECPAAGPIANVASIGGITGSYAMQANSNTVTLSLACGTSTITPTQTSTSTVTETVSTTAGSVTVSGTPTLTATPSVTGMSTSTSTHTKTGTFTCTATPTQTSTSTVTETVSTTAGSVTVSGTPTLTATPSVTGMPTSTSTHTKTVALSSTATPTCTVTHTGSASPSPTPFNTAPQGTPTFTPTAGVGTQHGIVERVICMPSVVRDSSHVEVFALCSGAVSNATLRLYSGSYTLVKQFSSGPMVKGWNRFSLPLGWFKGLPNGLYHLTLAASVQASPARTRVFVLK